MVFTEVLGLACARVVHRKTRQQQKNMVVKDLEKDIGKPLALRRKPFRKDVAVHWQKKYQNYREIAIIILLAGGLIS